MQRQIWHDEEAQAPLVPKEHEYPLEPSSVSELPRAEAQPFANGEGEAS